MSTMPVPAEESTDATERNTRNKGAKAQKQASIGSFFQRSSKRKKNVKQDTSPEKEEQEKKKIKIEDDVGPSCSSSSADGSNGRASEERKNGSANSKEVSNMETDLSSQNFVEEKIQKPLKKGLERCKECRQVIHKDEIKMFVGDPENAVEEFVMLCDPKLSLLTGDEQQFDSYDDRPQHKLTEFSVYDKCGHLAPFDTGLIDKNVELFFSGYVKPVYDETVDTEGGVCTKKMGPINEWWISGFDGGENALIGFSTAFAEYIMVRPADDYAPFTNAVAEKICMSKILIELVIENPEASYEELLNKIETTVPPESCSKLTEDSLLRHAQFLIEQVESYDSAAADYEEEAPLIASMCVRDLIKLAGVTLGKRRALRGVKVRSEKKVLGPTLATTTPLVRTVFDTFFKDQLDLKSSAKRKRRCGVCEVCQQPDCGKCRSCKDMIKFGGTGRAKQCCIYRRCPNLAVQEAEAEESQESQDEDAGPLKSPLKEDRSPKTQRRGLQKVAKTTVKWACEPHIEKKSRMMYKSVLINGSKIDVGDYVKVCPQNPTDPLYICRVCYMWEDTISNKKSFHAQWLYRSAETVLGESGDATELFLCDDCSNNPIGSIVEKCNVKVRELSATWSMEGGEEFHEGETTEDDQQELHFHKWYDIEEGCFCDPPEEFLKTSFEERYCPCCDREKKNEKWSAPTLNEKVDDTEETKKVLYKSLTWRGDSYAVGDCVYVNPEAYRLKKKPPYEGARIKKEQEWDEVMYPELYRSNEYIKGSNVDVAEPYRIGCILEIIQTKGNYGENKKLLVKLRKFYRPENTHKGLKATYSADLNLLYWSNEETTIEFESNVEGKCYVLYADDVDANINEYTENGPHRFYFKESYDADTEEFDTPPNKARMELTAVKGGKGKGKGKAKKGSAVFQKNSYNVEFPVYEKVERLRTLDIFAGCGGLSEGLHQVGVADSRWAVEFEPSAAQAYRLNNPGAVVFNADCNVILKMIMEGRETDDSGQRLPQRGEVDLLCGGPPCQGFSGMNRFNSREYSMFKNSLVVSYLSYCEYLRPRYFILENVRNFVSFKKGMVLKLVLKTLLKMGYQCEFGVLQAGCYGVAQTRRRAILIAAAPGEVLPKYPEPQHVFAQKGLSLSVMIDEKKYQALKRLHTAPYRTITVRDAMGDLPSIKNGANKLEMGYDGEPTSHFQKMMRSKHAQQILRDHICKEMSPLVEARMKHIPCLPGSDWRDLPNIVITLRDGSTTKKLLYLHDDKKQSVSSNGDLRGVCACATGAACDPADRQFNTLIPWCLPHTGNRHNHWAGLYGRLEWDGFFSTTVTNPEPMGKQGRVLHPEQHRVVSVRECARSQGFPDSVRFYGNILDKHRQIGNAVAPPMAAAIGQEMRKAMVQKMRRDITTSGGDAFATAAAPTDNGESEIGSTTTSDDGKLEENVVTNTIDEGIIKCEENVE